MKMNQTETPASAFRAAYAVSIAAKIKSLKRDGTVAMGNENLFAVTMPHGALYNHPGAIRGTNARYYLHEMFREIVAANPAFRKFVY